MAPICVGACDHPVRWFIDGEPVCTRHARNALRVIRQNDLSRPTCVTQLRKGT